MGSVSRDEAMVRTFDRTRQPERWGRIGDVGPGMWGCRAGASLFELRLSLFVAHKTQTQRTLCLASMCLFKLSSNFCLVDCESVYALPAR
jgi:hypothetical protein